MLRQGHVEARRLISGVRPPILDESGVVAAIAHLVHDPAFEQGPKIEFRSKVTFDRLAPVVENAIYRIVQEGLDQRPQPQQEQDGSWSAWSSGATACGSRSATGASGSIPAAVQENRFGLEGIRERARLLGGKCGIKSKPGKGTRIVVELPVVER